MPCDNNNDFLNLVVKELQQGIKLQALFVDFQGR